MTLREVCSEASIKYFRLNPEHLLFSYPLDTTNEDVLVAMQDYTAHYMAVEARDTVRALCDVLRERR